MISFLFLNMTFFYFYFFLNTIVLGSRARFIADMLYMFIEISIVPVFVYGCYIIVRHTFPFFWSRYHSLIYFSSNHKQFLVSYTININEAMSYNYKYLYFNNIFKHKMVTWKVSDIQLVLCM